MTYYLAEKQAEGRLRGDQGFQIDAAIKAIISDNA